MYTSIKAMIKLLDRWVFMESVGGGGQGDWEIRRGPFAAAALATVRSSCLLRGQWSPVVNVSLSCAHRLPISNTCDRPVPALMVEPPRWTGFTHK